MNTFAVIGLLIATAHDTPAAGVGTTEAIEPHPGRQRGDGWLSWRGPRQNGTGDGSGFPSRLDEPLWTYDISGAGTPVIANGRLFGLGHRGEREELREILFCLDAESGAELWEFAAADFLSDVVYNRYAIGSPTVDPETGDLYWLTTARELYCVSPNGAVRWRLSAAERFGMNTYPNGRTGAPAIDGDLVVIHGVSNSWGRLGPPADRFFAFHKETGELVWVATPGEGPPRLKDSSFSTPAFAWLGARRVFYAGDGSGNVVCVNARNGETLWRFPFSYGGINSSIVIHDGDLIAIHGKENLETSEHGGLIRLSPTAAVSKNAAAAPVLSPKATVWRAQHNEPGTPNLVAFTSSPTLAGDRLFVTVATGELVCVDANTGKQLWHKKLATDQIHASPLWVEDKLYVPMNPGELYVLAPKDEDATVLAKTTLEGNCLGAPAAWAGKIYVHSTAKLYCFGASPATQAIPSPSQVPGAAVSLQIIPSEVLLRPDEKATFTVRAVDAHGHVVERLKIDAAECVSTPYSAPSAKLSSPLDATFNEQGELVAGSRPSAGAVVLSSGDLRGVLRGRVVASVPYTEDFESFEVSVPHPTEPETTIAHPPVWWGKARFVWDVRVLDGNKVLTKTLDRMALQRGLTFIGHPLEHNYTLQADVMTDGNRRLASDVGLINQRYLIVLKGNHQRLAVVSNQERVNVSSPFPFKHGTWYSLQTRVDRSADGSGTVRVKAWLRNSPEPGEWTLEVPLREVHAHGAPGVYGFAVNGKHRVYIDNLSLKRTERKP